MFAQGDMPTTRPLKIGEKNNLDVKASNQGTLLRMPSVLDENFISKNEKPGVKMLPDRELLQAGHDMIIDPKVKEKREKGGVRTKCETCTNDKTEKRAKRNAKVKKRRNTW